VAFKDGDAMLLEASRDKPSLKTGQLTFNKGYSTTYEFNFRQWYQLNLETKVKRQIRRCEQACAITTSSAGYTERDPQRQGQDCRVGRKDDENMTPLEKWRFLSPCNGDGDPVFFDNLLDDKQLAGQDLFSAAKEMQGVTFYHSDCQQMRTFRFDTSKSVLEDCLSFGRNFKDPAVQRSLGVDKIAAIRAWTNGVLCYAVNTLLRTPDRNINSVKPGLYYLRLLFEALHALPEKYIFDARKGQKDEGRRLFRAEYGVRPNFDDRVTVGSDLQFFQPVSFTTNAKVMQRFKNAKMPRTVYIIDGGVGYNIRKFSSYAGEDEILMECVLVLRVTKVEKFDAKHWAVQSGENQEGLHVVECTLRPGVELLSGSPVRELEKIGCADDYGQGTKIPAQEKSDPKPIKAKPLPKPISKNNKSVTKPAKPKPNPSAKPTPKKPNAANDTVSDEDAASESMQDEDGSNDEFAASADGGESRENTDYSDSDDVPLQKKKIQSSDSNQNKGVQKKSVAKPAKPKPKAKPKPSGKPKPKPKPNTANYAESDEDASLQSIQDDESSDDGYGATGGNKKSVSKPAKPKPKAKPKPSGKPKPKPKPNTANYAESDEDASLQSIQDDESSDDGYGATGGNKKSVSKPAKPKPKAKPKPGGKPKPKPKPKHNAANYSESDEDASSQSIQDEESSDDALESGSDDAYDPKTSWTNYAHPDLFRFGF